MPKRFFRIVAPHFVAGIEPGWRAAPILRYMVRWMPEKIIEYCRRKGWQVEELNAPPAG